MKYNILIVDDEKRACSYLRKIINRKLENDGSIDIVHTGECAVDMVSKGKYNVILLDIIMPGIDGLETVRRIRMIDTHVIVVMLTCVANEYVAKEALRKGANDYMMKPVDVDYLISVVLPVYTVLGS